MCIPFSTLNDLNKFYHNITYKKPTTKLMNFTVNYILNVWKKINVNYYFFNCRKYVDKYIINILLYK